MIYYSQTDARWKNKMYTIVNDKTQTIGSSGCGPTCASMIVANLTDKTVLPDTMATDFISKGFRTSNNGTYASSMKYVAEKFNLDYKQTKELNLAIDVIKKGGMVVARCVNGLFTTGGHYIVIADINDNILTVLDPQIYSGKFERYDRKGKVKLEGNKVYCSVTNMLLYGAVKEYYCFERKETKEMNKEQAIEKLKTILEEQTIKFLDAYRYGDDLILKIAKNLK